MADPSHPAQHRLQGQQRFVHLFRGIQTVQNNPSPHHIKATAQAHNPGGIVQVFNRNFHPTLLQQIAKLQVPLPLGLRLNKAGFVRRGKVAEKPLRVNPRQIANGLANIRALFIHLEADTAHTRVQCKVKRHLLALAHRLRRQCLGCLHGEDRQSHILFYRPRKIVRKYRSQYQNGQGYTCLAQFHCFFNTSHAVKIKVLFIPAADICRTVTVSVRFNHTQQLRIRPDLLPNGGNIRLQRI